MYRRTIGYCRRSHGARPSPATALLWSRVTSGGALSCLSAADAYCNLPAIIGNGSQSCSFPATLCDTRLSWKLERICGRNLWGSRNPQWRVARHRRRERLGQELRRGSTAGEPVFSIGTAQFTIGITGQTADLTWSTSLRLRLWSAWTLSTAGARVPDRQDIGRFVSSTRPTFATSLAGARRRILEVAVRFDLTAGTSGRPTRCRSSPVDLLGTGG